MTVSNERHLWERDNYKKLTRRQKKTFNQRNLMRRLAVLPDKEVTKILKSLPPTKIKINSRQVLLEPFINIEERRRRFKERYG